MSLSRRSRFSFPLPDRAAGRLGESFCASQLGLRRRRVKMDMDVAHARRLADLIGASVARLEEEDGDDSSGTRKVRREHSEVQTIVSAAAQLAALVRPPAQVLLEVATGFALSAALRLVVEANVPEVIRALTNRSQAPSADDSGVGLIEEGNDFLGERDAEGASIGDISRLCGVEAGKLERILRLLATHHIFVECPAEASSTESISNNPEKEPGARGGGEARFANNTLSAALDSGVPLEDVLLGHPSSSEVDLDPASLSATRKRWAAKYGAEAPGAGLAALVGILTDESMFHMTALTEVLLGTATATATASHPTSANVSKGGEMGAEKTNENERTNENENETLGLNHDPESPFLAPFARARALPHTTMFEWLGLPANAHRLHRFGCAMRGMNALEREGAILKGFDFTALPPGSVVVDVGGGVGAASLPVLRANAHLRLVVQDTEQVVRVAPGFWERHYPEALHSGRVKFEEQDFFEEQPHPRVYFPECDTGGTGGKKSAYVYLLRMIAHNWGDSRCLRILERLRGAVGEGDTKLVLVDSVLMPACRSRGQRSEYCKDRDSSMDVDAGVDPMTHDRTGAKEIRKSMTKIREAPEPLLPNWGAANALAYKLDLIMLANHNALERTLPHFRSLLSRAGWEIVEVHTQDEGGAGAGAGESWMSQIVAVPAA
ncbi:S-adenosyl-L-methionine-dependent methyltransferase [Sanghuangporus baumii]|uniref:S-adenosyl-L-methionine-dependent methyltransferase n=1 Tax=Sanghuangporus baumii TaxID=108892 RepID=A0A9Q5HYH8_SANBA|nr:S-adenosyl-L-methionine-dependent methyltransferase [Sanghuangporus baumii]